MFDNVVHGFLGSQKHIVPEFGRNGLIGQMGGDFEAITQAGNGQIFLRIFTDVVYQTVEGVIGRIYGPDDLIESMGGVTGGLRNLTRMGLDLDGVVFIRLRQFAQQSDLGQIRAELIVKVARDPGAFFFQRLLLPETLQLTLQSLSRNIVNRADNHAEEAQTHQSKEPGCSPKGWQNNNGQGTATLVPDLVLITGLYTEPVFAWWKFAVEGRANISGLGPRTIVSFHSIAKTGALGSAEIQAGVIDLEAFIARLNRNRFREFGAYCISVLTLAFDKDRFNQHGRRIGVLG